MSSLVLGTNVISEGYIILQGVNSFGIEVLSDKGEVLIVHSRDFGDLAADLADWLKLKVNRRVVIQENVLEQI